MILLGDDGTLDTVFYCNQCGLEFRHNYDPYDETGDDPADVQQQAYLDWVAETQAKINSEHIC